MKKVLLFLLIPYFVLAPFYFFHSGIPQISDLILLLIIVLFIFWGDFKKDSILQLCMVTLIIILFVNGMWSLILSDPHMNLNSLYLFFNLGILIVFINSYRYLGERLLSILSFSVIFSLAIQFIVLLFMGDFSGSRQTLFFNNPNQLGYYALIQLSLVILLYYINKLGFKLFMLGTIFSVYLVFLSLSSAAILASIFLIFAVLLHLLILKFDAKKSISILLGLSVLLIINHFTGIIEDSSIAANVENRLNSKQYDTESNFSERRYDRIIEYKEYWLLGAGQGGFERFREGGEIHANIPAFFFYYGIIGLIFLLALFIKLIDRPTFITIIVLIAIHFYGLTHQGLRNPMFWILIGFIYVINKNKLINIKSFKRMK